MKYEDLITKYHNFIYHDFKINDLDESLEVVFDFEIEGLCHFNPTFQVSKSIITNQKINDKMLELLIFNIGMVEAISYYKLACPKTFIIESGFLNSDQQKWWQKLFFLGLGEFLYKNNIEISSEELVTFKCHGSEFNIKDDDFISQGNLIPIGGGKDSCVTVELLKGQDNDLFTINAKDVHKGCIKIAGYDSFININRTLDKNMLRLNEEGYLNGHTPFSSLVAFYSYLIAYLTNKKYIILSNEDSANEPTVLNTVVNHQYSKSFEFEKDFNYYVKRYIGLDINYFSLLRPIKEIRIAYLFSKHKKYHEIFKSCNVGSKKSPWIWCGSCPKCLFVFTILSAFLPLDYLSNIFGRNLFEDQELLTTFEELLGFTKVKPFECVGETDEVKWAVSRAINNNKANLPYLLNYYNENYPLYEKDLLNSFNQNNLVPEKFTNIVKDMMNND